MKRITKKQYKKAENEILKHIQGIGTVLKSLYVLLDTPVGIRLQGVWGPEAKLLYGIEALEINKGSQNLRVTDLSDCLLSDLGGQQAVTDVFKKLNIKTIKNKQN